MQGYNIFVLRFVWNYSRNTLNSYCKLPILAFHIGKGQYKQGS